MSYRPIELIGEIVQYILNGFKGNLKDHMERKWSFIIGLLFIFLFVLLLNFK